MGRKSIEQSTPVSDEEVVEQFSRRLSKKPSFDRHGRFWTGSVQDQTARAVTPESPSTPLVGSPGRSGIRSSPNARSAGREGPHVQPVYNTSSSADNDTTSGHRRRKSRSSTKRQEESEAESSPSSFLTKTRQKFESLTTSAGGAQAPDEQVGSIGYPSVIPSPPILESYDRRPSGKVTTIRTFSSTTSSDNQRTPLTSPVQLTTDHKKILQLMKTTCGRMHGILFYRPATSESWASGYCAINVAPGSLVSQVKGDVTMTRTLIPDLRGCRVRTHYDSEAQKSYISVTTAFNESRYHFRPPVPETFDSWLAALLCWQPMRPKSRSGPSSANPALSTAEKRQSLARRFVDTAGQKKTSVVKIGRLLLWDGPVPPPPQRRTLQQISSLEGRRPQAPLSTSWIRASCTLHENGDFKIIAEPNSEVLTKLTLPHLSRDAIQQVHHSITGRDSCLIVHPQYTAVDGVLSELRPLIFGFETRQAADVWFTLLRSFAMPEIYDCRRLRRRQPGEHSTEIDKAGSMFRVERSITVKITEVRFNAAKTGNQPLPSQNSPQEPLSGSYYAELMIGDDLKARTSVRQGDRAAFWAEEYRFDRLPFENAAVSILVKDGSATEREWTTVTRGAYEQAQDEEDFSRAERIEVSTHDAVYGHVELQLDDLEKHREFEKRWPMINKDGQALGDILMKVALREVYVLMQDQYSALSDLLLNISNGLTSQFAQVLGNELRTLSDLLLDIYQVAGKTTEWISSLLEEEIDGIYKEAPPSRLRFIGRVHSSDSLESSEDREVLVRDLSRTANNEANLLFRGNSLVTKALDAHMRRLGKEYLEETLGDFLRDVVLQQPDCEIDPARLSSKEQRDQNWTTLFDLTNQIWETICSSANSCPPGLRSLFRHIRSCAEDRYGSFIKTVKYTSVSGFLFLRFFCPAILNPELFDLVPGQYET